MNETSKTCATISCHREATGEISWPGWDGAPVTESVCDPCGQEYINRPSLSATMVERSAPQHADYPHEPGRLHDCYACESGPCVCTVESAPCVSDECTQTGGE